MTLSPIAHRAGFGRADITAFAPSLSLFGWGHPDNRPRRVAAPLHARALALAPVEGGAVAVYVCCDLGLISARLRLAVEARLRADGVAVDPSALMITATHTHSGPSGLSDHLFYASAGPGFVGALCEVIAGGIVAAVRQAIDALAPARVYFHEGVIPLADRIAFNRAIVAYNTNPDVTPVTEARRDEALDRRMALLRVDDAEGRRLGLVSWFGLHGTCIHRDHSVVHPDHKGEAATRVEAYERARGNDGFVAIFAQTAPADVTPNHRWSPTRKLLIGRFDDDLETAAWVGEVQARHAITIAEKSPREGRALDGRLDVALTSIDLFSAPASPDFVGGRTGLRMAPPALGWSFMAGTPEGQGPLGAFNVELPMLSTWKRRAQEVLHRRADLHGAKVAFWELGAGPRGRIAGVLRPTNPLVQTVPDTHSRYIARAARDPATAAAPWSPQRATLQLLRIGDVVVAGLPFEPTVTSGRRVARAVADALQGQARRVVVNGYANGYAGYLATPEEYELQGYEGASTLYGRWTLPALCTAFRDLGESLRGARPPTPAVTAPPDARGSAPETGAPVHRFRPLEEIMSPTLSPAARLQWFYEEMSRARVDALAHLPLVFTDDIAFRDPFRATRGMTDFRELFNRLLRQYPEVSFTNFRVAGDDASFTLTYEMHLRMAVGPTFVTPMASVCRTRNGLVNEVDDYYDFTLGITSPSKALRRLYQRVVSALFL